MCRRAEWHASALEFRLQPVCDAAANGVSLLTLIQPPQKRLDNLQLLGSSVGYDPIPSRVDGDSKVLVVKSLVQEHRHFLGLCVVQLEDLKPPTLLVDGLFRSLRIDVRRHYDKLARRTLLR